MTFSIKRLLFIIKVYYATKLYTKVKEELRNEYPKSSNIPSTSIIKCSTDKFEKMSFVHDILGKGRKLWSLRSKTKSYTDQSQAYCFQQLFSVTSTGSTYINLSQYLRNKISVSHSHLSRIETPDAGKRLHFCLWLCNSFTIIIASDGKKLIISFNRLFDSIRI